MKKLMTALLAVAFLTGSVALAADKPADTKTEKTTAKKGKKSTEKKDTEKKEEKKAPAKGKKTTAEEKK
jgi:Ni/Co efflux regulator RcnB